MKIVCDNCATKYSIADEKVRGKVFKIRCKKCSHIIVVRGNEGGAAAGASDAGADGFPGDDPATTVAPGATMGATGSDSVWHLVVDREQIGPLTASEVRQKFAAGEIDVETYGWREGFADWLRLGSIDDFRDLGGAQSEPEGATRRTDSADLFSSSNQAQDDSGDAGSDLFGSAAAQAASAPAPAAADAFGGGGGGGLFGAPEQAAPAPRQSRTSSPGFAPSQPQAGMAAAMGGGGDAGMDGGGRPMTGQRNENSVLFSLNNLQALASGGGGTAPAPKSGVDNRPGFANSQTEGSGLIDIRAMAASTLAASPSSSSKGGRDEPEMQAAPIFSPMAAPILMPAAPSGPPKWIWAVLGVGVLAVLGIVVVGILLLTRKPEATVVATGPTATAPGATAGNPGATATPPPVEKAAAPEKTDTKATAPAEKTDDKVAAKSHESKPGKTHEARPDKGAKPVKAESPAAAAPAEAAPTPAPKKGGRKDALDDLLDGASPDKPKAAKHEAAEPSGGGGGDDSLPDQLEKSQVVGGMQSVKGKVGSCYDQFKVPGMASVQVTIQHSGSVSSATVGGSFAGTPTASCVEKAVKSAHFPKFKGAPMSLTYPFMLR